MSEKAPKILDANGHPLALGARVRHGGHERTVVVLSRPYQGIVSVGTYHGSLAEYEPHMCIPYAVAEATNGGSYLASDLVLTTPTKEES